MLFEDISILDEDFQVKEHQFVLVEGDRIKSVSGERPRDYKGEVISGQGRLLMPAFYNAHAHTPMTLLRGYGGGLNLNDWLTTKIFPFEALLTPEDVYLGMKWGIAEMLRFGIVSTTDMYMETEKMVQAVLETGVKTNVGVALVCFDPEMEAEKVPDFILSKYLFENYHGAGDGRVKIDMAPHAEYSSTPKSIRGFAEYSKSVGANMHVHLSETQKEHEECKARHGKTPAKYFLDLGMFDCPTTAAHCVWLEEEDREIFAEKGVTVACNPISNLKLASGICDVSALLQKGINVTVATDGVASNNSMNMFEEMKFFALLQKAKHYDPTLITPQQALYAATRAGALSQSRPDCGLIKEGFKADLMVLDIDQPHMKPVHSMLDNLVYSADGEDVEMTICDGKILYNNGEFTTIDMEETGYEIERSRKRILSEL